MPENTRTDTHTTQKPLFPTFYSPTYQFHRIKKNVLKKNFTVPKDAKEGRTFGFFIIQVVAENQNNQRRDPLATKNCRKSLEMPKNSETKPSELYTVEAAYMGRLGTGYSCLIYPLSLISVVQLTTSGRPGDRNMPVN